MTGGVVSSTLMVWLAVAVLPQPSVAVQVRVTLYSFGQEPLVVTSVKVTPGAPQASVTVGVTNEGDPVHSIVEGPGIPENEGGVISTVRVIV